MEKTPIECTNSLRVIKKRDTEQTFFYCNPSYSNANMGHRKGHTESDLRDLLEAFANIKGMLFSLVFLKMQKNTSRRHHYLPVHYLKGFCDSQGKLCVYSKKARRFLTNQSPESKFFEKDLNTITLSPKHIFPFEETILQKHDDEAALLFQKLRKMNIGDPDPFNMDERAFMVWFILNLFWRIPSSDKALETLLEKEGINTKYLRAYGENVTPEKEKEIFAKMLEVVKGDKELQKSFKFIYPHISFQTEEHLKIMEKWKFGHCFSDKICFITGDNPFVMDNPNFQSENILNEFLFPLTQRHIHINSESNLRFIEGYFMMYINVCIFHNSENLVCSGSEEVLRKVVAIHEVFEKMGRMNGLQKNTFQLLHYESKFETHESYVRTTYPEQADRLLAMS